ncbi:MAG TPA: glycosyltransferase family 2 protein [Longimicrobium sp.]|nr:glycosyltransferase family 2 protein [Longimicrobium sp.]
MIYICIPALNEEPTIGVLLWRVRQVMAEFRRDYHLIVLDDGSTDATAEVLEPYTRVLPLDVIRNPTTQGYAAAVDRLLREAVAHSTHPKRDAVVLLQGDFTEPPEEIPTLVRKLEGGADVVGSTVGEVVGEVARGMRWSRRGLPWLLSRAALPKDAGDPFSGFRAYRVQVVRRALADRAGQPLLTRDGWAANAELLLAVAPHSRRADEATVGLRYTRRQRESRFRAWPAVRETWDLARRAPRRERLVSVEAAVAVEAPPSPAPPRAPREAERGEGRRRAPQAPASGMESEDGNAAVENKPRPRRRGPRGRGRRPAG